MKTLLLTSFLLLVFPVALHAEDLIPAICQQVLTPEASTSVAQIIKEHFVSRAKGVPSKVVQDVRGAVDGFANSLADKVESYKSDGEIVAGDGGSVLGTSTSMVGEQSFLDSVKDDALAVLAFLLRHWLITLSVVGGIAIALMLRF